MKSTSRTGSGSSGQTSKRYHSYPNLRQPTREGEKRTSKKITIDDLARIEGQGGIEVIIEGAKVANVQMQVPEGPRFFEALIEGVKYDKVPDITRRICGICTASHSTASIRAIEKAFGVEVTPQTELLRNLLMNGEVIASHALHLFMLALPDYLGYPDAIKMVDKYPEEVKAAFQLRRAGNMIHNVLSGREVHGMNDRVGGFATIPKEGDLFAIRKSMECSKPAAELAVKIFSSLDVPEFNSGNTLMALDPGDKFGYIGDYVLISDGGRRKVEDYKELTNECVVKHSNAKHSYYKGFPLMVGALPRIALSGNKLSRGAKELLKENKDRIVRENSLSNNFAQAIELVHCVERCVDDIDALLDGYDREEPAEVELHAGSGVGAVEAPRGMLCHEYSFDDDGCITKANVITPTAINCANMEKDFKIATERTIAEGKIGELEKTLELVARAYDPCISCSVHFVRVKRI